MQKLNGGYSYVTCYKIPRDEISRFDIATCKQPRETLASYYNRQSEKPTILTNGGFFNMSNGAPCFNLLDEGQKKAYDSCYKWGIGVLSSNGRVQFGSIDSGIFRDFISGYPLLVEDGKKSVTDYARSIDGAHPRTILGYNDEAIFIVAVDGRKPGKPGMTFSQCSDLMIKFGCVYAINLDGGGSTRMLYKGKTVNDPLENRPVDNVIAIYTKSSATSNSVKTETAIESTGSDRTYTVKYGDSLWKIAKNEMGNGLHYTVLAKYNNMQASDNIRVGLQLKIPYSYDIHKSNTQFESMNKGSIYVVKPGDSLWLIAQKVLGNGAKYNDIKSYNNLKSNIIYTGQVLKIPR